MAEAAPAAGHGRGRGGGGRGAGRKRAAPGLGPSDPDTNKVQKTIADLLGKRRQPSASGAVSSSDCELKWYIYHSFLVYTTF